MARQLTEDDLEQTTLSHSGGEVDRVVAGERRDRAYLVVLAGANVGEMFRIEGETTLGRGSNVTIRLYDEGISRRHARIVPGANEVIVEDLKSANGTQVNGIPITLKALQDGDKIRLGSTTILKFTYHDKLDENFQRQMYDAALRDGLTKAFNKRFFTDRFETEYAYARRHKTMLSLIMFDVDHFKKINDTHGHLGGDYVLATLARITSAALRAEDVFARYGGEEFGIICRAVPLEKAALLGERLRSIVETHVFEFGSKVIPVAISVGVAAYPDVPAEGPAELIAKADEALYEAKHSGRNCVRIRPAS